jgi:hypothetical protein
VLLALMMSGSVGCSTAVDHPAASTGGSAAPHVVDLTRLDTGNYPVRPLPSLGTAGSPGNGSLVDAYRMADFVVGPWEVDATLTSPNGAAAEVLKNPSAVGLIEPAAIAQAVDDHSFINGFVSAREATGQTVLQNTVLRFADAAAAAAAAAEMGANALTEPLAIRSPVQSVPIPGHPDALASSHSYTPHGATQPWAAVRSFTPHGPFVLAQLAEAKGGSNAAVSLIAKLIDAQGPRIDQFQPTDPAKFADLQFDPTGLLARTLPAAADHTGVTQRAVYQQRAALHFQQDPIASAALFAQTGMDALSMYATNVYQAKDAASATRIVDEFAGEQQSAGKPVDGVNSLPDSRCFQLNGGIFYCVVPADRYAIEVQASQLLDAHQMAAAQYALLFAT